MNDVERKILYETSMELQKNQLKLHQRNMAIETLDDRRYLRREQERELRKSQCEVIEIEEGTVIAKTLNLRIDCKPRILTNFSNPSLLKVVHAENSWEHLYLFRAVIENKYEEVFLLSEKMNNEKYIIKKLAEIGAEFYGKEAQEKFYAKKVMTKLIRGAVDVKWIPEECGWYIAENSNIKFYERGKITWDQARKLAI